jgi:KaiC/GvpD/RAD55 family RecA-like ATPase
MNGLPPNFQPGSGKQSELSPGAPMLHFALDYAGRGWPVFPCNPINKRPFPRGDVDPVTGKTIKGTGGFKKASLDPEQITAWWKEWPGAMIGIPMGSRTGVWALDPDAPKRPSNIDGRENWAQLKLKNSNHAHTHTHNTPGGGQHILFKYHADKPITNREGGIATLGINVRGEGGYVIAPPSMTADGKRYEFAEPLDAFAFAEAPDWLYDLILSTPSIPGQASARPEPAPRPKPIPTKRQYADAALRGECDELAATVTGNRNKQLNNAALKLGTLVAAGELSEGEVVGALYDAAVANGLVADDGERAAMATINSGLRKGLQTPREIPEPKAKHLYDGKNSNLISTKPATPVEIFWHGNDYGHEARAWLVKDLIPQTGQGLQSGQWGTRKTFVAIDLSASVMTGTDFAGHRVDRRGGVLFIAAEGASEIPIRLQGVVEKKLKRTASSVGGAPLAADLDRLPFAWIEECPSLKEDASFERLMNIVLEAAVQMKERFNVDLVLIIIDTLSASADFADANDAAEGQRIMNRLNTVSRRTGAFVMAVDHFGKATEAGTRGTSAKEAAADVVLALLADRDVSGTISKTRMAVRKLRGGATGAETPFDLKVVDIGTDGETTGIIEWELTVSAAQKSPASKERWPKSLRIFRSAMQTALASSGAVGHPFGTAGPAVRMVVDSAVRTEFMSAYPVSAENDKLKVDAKRQAFNRALKAARDRSLICSREIAGVDRLWLVRDKDATHADGPDTS